MRTTIEKNLPFFNKLEQENKILKMQVSNKSARERQLDKLNNKVRMLERKNNGQQAENEKSMKKLE